MDVALNLDDDVYVKKERLICVSSWYRRLRDSRGMIGPFVRRTEGTKYIIYELTDSSSYSVLRPAVLMLLTYLCMNMQSPNTHGPTSTAMSRKHVMIIVTIFTQESLPTPSTMKTLEVSSWRRRATTHLRCNPTSQLKFQIPNLDIDWIEPNLSLIIFPSHN